MLANYLKNMELFHARGKYDFPGYSYRRWNEVVAHGIPNDRKLEEGDLINIDVSV